MQEEQPFYYEESTKGETDQASFYQSAENYKWLEGEIEQYINRREQEHNEKALEDKEQFDEESESDN